MITDYFVFDSEETLEKHIGEIVSICQKRKLCGFNNPKDYVLVTPQNNRVSVRTTIYEIASEAVYTNSYDGVVVMDISEFENSYREEMMSKLIKFFKSELKECCVMIVADKTCRKFEAMKNYISRRFDAEELNVGGIKL